MIKINGFFSCLYDLSSKQVGVIDICLILALPTNPEPKLNKS